MLYISPKMDFALEEAAQTNRVSRKDPNIKPALLYGTAGKQSVLSNENCSYSSSVSSFFKPKTTIPQEVDCDSAGRNVPIEYRPPALNQEKLTKISKGDVQDYNLFLLKKKDTGGDAFANNVDLYNNWDATLPKKADQSQK